MINNLSRRDHEVFELLEFDKKITLHEIEKFLHESNEIH
jgi:hypothetical protein